MKILQWLPKAALCSLLFCEAKWSQDECSYLFYWLLFVGKPGEWFYIIREGKRSESATCSGTRVFPVTSHFSPRVAHNAVLERLSSILAWFSFSKHKTERPHHLFWSNSFLSAHYWQHNYWFCSHVKKEAEDRWEPELQLILLKIQWRFFICVNLPLWIGEEQKEAAKRVYYCIVQPLGIRSCFSHAMFHKPLQGIPWAFFLLTAEILYTIMNLSCLVHINFGPLSIASSWCSTTTPESIPYSCSVPLRWC